MEAIKPVVILTSFWDAESIIADGYFLFDHNGKTGRINFVSESDKNYSVSSISLSCPDFDKKKMLNIRNSFVGRIDAFCPKWNMLKKYKDNANDYEWENYEEDYYDILKDRKNVIKDWIESLKSNHIYILCCWENTSESVHCHRETLYEAFSKSKAVKDKAIVLFRDGKKKYKKKTTILIDVQQGIDGGQPLSHRYVDHPVPVNYPAPAPIRDPIEVSFAADNIIEDPTTFTSSPANMELTFDLMSDHTARVVDEMIDDAMNEYEQRVGESFDDLLEERATNDPVRGVSEVIAIIDDITFGNYT